MQPARSRVVGQRTEPLTDWAASEAVFLFFSNRLGCFGSLLLSIAVTVVLLLLFRVI
jgi:hypothetical protein